MSHAPRSRRISRPKSVVVAVLLCAGMTGCSSVDSSQLESRLREQESFINDLEGQLDKTRRELEVAQTDAEGLRTQLADSGRDRLVAEQAAILSKVEGIKLNPLLTRGVDTDGAPGDDLLSVLIAPHDGDGELVKLPGNVEIEMLDLSRPEGQRQLGRWSFTTAQTRANWHAGFLSAGFLYELQWKVPPQREDVTLHVTLTTPDGRKFDTTSPLKIENAASALARRTRELNSLNQTRSVSRTVVTPARPGVKPASAERPVPDPMDLPDSVDPADVDPGYSEATGPKVTPAGGNEPAEAPVSKTEADAPSAVADPIETSDRFEVDEIPQRR